MSRDGLREENLRNKEEKRITGRDMDTEVSRSEKKDELDFIPTLILNMGSDRLTQTHTNRIFDRPALSSRKKSDFSNKFQVQSIAASLDFTYMVKKFFIQPIVYFDYYLPETTENRFSAIFSVAAGFSF